MKCSLMIAAGLAVFALAGCEQASESASRPAQTTDSSKAAEQSPTGDTNVNKSADAEPLAYELHVSGMTCTHCQATVTKLLEGLDGVASAQVDHTTGKAVVTMKPGAKLDEKAAHEVVDKDSTLDSCTLTTPTN